MKKQIIFILICLLSISASAQEKGFYYGARFGLGEASLKSDAFDETNSKLLWTLGGATAYQFTKNVGLSADFLVTGKGTKASGVTEESGITGTTDYPYNGKVNLVYLDVPLLLKFSIGIQKVHFRAFAGPSLNFAFGGLYERTYENANYNENNGFSREISTLETIDNALVYGLGVDAESSDGRLFFLDARIGKSMGSIGTLNGEKLKSSTFSLTAGYLFH